MDKLQIFKNSEFGEVRTVIIENEPWFVAKDVADALKYSETNAMTRRLDDEDVISTKLTDMNMRSTLINESGLYAAVIGSQLPSAKKFKRWITSEVLPQIRKTGTYIPDLSALSPELQLMNAIVAQMSKDAIQLAKLQEESSRAIEEIQEIREVVEIKPFDNWRETTNSLINKICQKTGDYKDTRHKIYDALNTRARVDIKRRLENMRARMVYAGSSKSKADGLTYLDVIAEDNKLIEIYTAIVKEMAIKKGVN